MGSLFKYCFILLTAVLLSNAPAVSQNYHAMNGSSYAGSLGVGNNPASILNTPYAWDVDLVSGQLKYATNAVTLYKSSLLSFNSRSEYAFDKGYFSRYANGNFNVNLLNTRIALDRQQAVAFGLNLRGYFDANSSPYNYIDTIKTLNQFLKINQQTQDYHLKFTASSWIEIFASYSRTLWDREEGRLNVGVTVKAMRGITGVFAEAGNFTVEPEAPGTAVSYTVGAGNASYAYSSNYDGRNGRKAGTDNIGDFLTHTEGGLSLDLGAEYIIKNEAVATFQDEDSYYDYEWKIGLSLLDLGQNNYKYGNQSRRFSEIRTNVSDAALQSKLHRIHSLRTLNDSVVGVVNNAAALSGTYTIINPARLVINVDRYLFNDFYLNGNLSVNLSPLAPKDRLYVKESNLFTVTPRWETRRLGAYLPIQYYREGKLWIGGAIKLGPVLIGIHKWGNVFSTTKMSNSGGYFALIIHPTRNTRGYRDKRINCPEFW